MTTKHSHRYLTIRRVTIVNALANLLLAVLKLIIGWIGFSQALIADGIHSLTDLLGDAFVYMTAHYGNQEPDSDHPYGHKRVETLGAIITALMLIFIGFYLVISPLWELLHHAPMHHVSAIVLIVAVASVFINEGLFQYGAYFGKKFNSQLLIANAWHNRSDALVSIVVVISTIAALFHFHHVDLIGAIVIGAIIVYSGAKMIYQCVLELIDTGVDEATLKAIKQIILEIPEITSLHELRSRTHSGDIFLDLHVQVPPEISVSEGHQIAELVHHRLRSSDHNIMDVTVHIDPENDESEHLNTQLPFRQTITNDIDRLCKTLPAYALLGKTTFHYFQGKVTIELYFNGPITHEDTQAYVNTLKTLTYCKDVRCYQALT